MFHSSRNTGHTGYRVVCRTDSKWLKTTACYSAACQHCFYIPSSNYLKIIIPVQIRPLIGKNTQNDTVKYSQKVFLLISW